ncbi:phage tail protein [Sinorhizobium medicae]|uniref:phage tail protein n=1 Tax=Sinorhizobium medicae TaxID=110321 RepID=UPI0012972415|nr:phage tail protein [Sinorhizobium medicae]MQX46605.1 hypothetical protein [Sinorhizobium medicae]
MPAAVVGIIGAIGAAVSGIASTVAGLFGAIGSTAIGTALLKLGLSIGLSYLVSAFNKPKQPKPEDVQQSFRQATAPRVRHYGRAKASGTWVFAEAKGGHFYKVIAIGQGEIDAIEEYWIDDKQVTPDAVTGKTGTNVRLRARTGKPTETHYDELAAVFPESWTAEHRGDGVASVFVTQYAVEQKNYLRNFPNGINTTVRLVFRGAKVKNPITGATAWSDNAAAVIRDYMTHQDGMRLPEKFVATAKAHAGWRTAFTRAAETVPLKGGLSEPRYRLWGSYQMDERPADVLSRMLAACDGRLVPTADGGLTLDIGTWAEPAVVLDNDAITGFSELGRGRDILTTANTVRATFLDPSQDYQAADADPWVDAEDVSVRGEIEQDIQLNMAPSHSQARRLMKLAAWRANPAWIATFQCNLRGLAAFGERFVRINYPLLGINSVFEVDDFRFVIDEGGLLAGVTIQVHSMPATAYSWDPDQEQGDAPVSENSETDDEIPVPDPPTVTFVGMAAELSFEPSPSPILNIEARWKRTNQSTWTESGVLANTASTFTTPALQENVEYEFQLRYVTERGLEGNWSVSALGTPSGDPAALDSFTAVGGLGRATLNFDTATVDGNLNTIAIYRVPFGQALNKTTHFLTRISAAPNDTIALTDGDPAPVNLLTNSGFSSDVGWTTTAGWAIANGKASHALGVYGGISQAVTLAAGTVYRIAYTILDYDAGALQTRLTGGTPVDGEWIWGNERKLLKLTAASGNTAFQVDASTDCGASINDAVIFAETGTCAPQGVWNYYAIPESAALLEGPASGPITATII